MATKKSTIKLFSVLLIMMFLLTDVQPARAGLPASSHNSSCDFGWAKGMGGAGGNNNDESRGIVLDSSGNIYTTGNFAVTADFDPGPGTANLTSAGLEDIFISKLDKDGNFLWAKKIGGTDVDYGFSIALDSNNNVFTTGFYSGTVDFDPGDLTYNLTSVGFSYDIFVSKLNSSGDFVWAKSLGGIEREYSYGVAVDSNDNIITTGYFKGTADFDPSPGIYNLVSAGSSDIFISKLDKDGNLIWAKRIGGANDDASSGIAIDLNGNVYTTGSYYGTVDFDPGAGTSNLVSGWNDIFVSKLDNSGNFVWARSMGGAGLDEGRDIAVDSNDNVYTTGYYVDTADFDPGDGIFNLTSAGTEHDIFVSKLDSSGNFVWAKSMGGSGGMDADFGNGITLDSNGNVYTTGSFGGTADFDPGAGTFNLTSVGLNGIFVSKLDNNGDFVWAKGIGGTSFNRGNDIVLGARDSVFTTGLFMGTADFDPGPGIFNLISAGGSDIFVSKLNNAIFCTFMPLIGR